MRKHYHFLLTRDDGPVLRLSCGHRRLVWIGAVAAVFFILFTGLGLRSAALSMQSAGLRARVAALEQQLVTKDAEQLAQQRLDGEEKGKLGAKIAALTTEKNTVMAAAVRELSSRSALIDRMLAKIGLNNPEHAGTSNASPQASAQMKAQANTGGPFIALEPQAVDLLHRADHDLATLSKLPLGMPTNGSLSSPFGNRIDPLNWRRAFHAGMDFKSEIGSKVFATADGVVKEAGWNGSFGRCVEIDHGNGYSTVYGHLSKVAIQAGSQVQRGQLIGYVGSSGRSTGPHLHYELRYQGTPIDPNKYAMIASTIRADREKAKER